MLQLDVRRGRNLHTHDTSDNTYFRSQDHENAILTCFPCRGKADNETRGSAGAADATNVGVGIGGILLGRKRGAKSMFLFSIARQTTENLSRDQMEFENMSQLQNAQT